MSNPIDGEDAYPELIVAEFVRPTTELQAQLDAAKERIAELEAWEDEYREASYWYNQVKAGRDSVRKWSAAWKALARYYHERLSHPHCGYCGDEMPNDRALIIGHIFNCEGRPEYNLTKALADVEVAEQLAESRLKVLNEKEAEARQAWIAKEQAEGERDAMRATWIDPASYAEVMDGYALTLAQSQTQLDAARAQMQRLREACKSARSFVVIVGSTPSAVNPVQLDKLDRKLRDALKEPEVKP